MYIFNNRELTEKIIDIVKQEQPVVLMKTLESMKLKNDDDMFCRGYDEAINDMIAMLKGER